MRRKILTSNEEVWLMTHYCNRSNEALAEQLSSMVKERYSREIKSCRARLSEGMGIAESSSLIAYIRFMENFTGVTPMFVKRVVIALGGAKKDALYISRLNREKRVLAHRQRQIQQAEVITSVVEWLRSFTIGQSRFGRITSANQFNSFSAALSRWNRIEGQKKGILLAAEYDKPNLLVKVAALKSS